MRFLIRLVALAFVLSAPGTQTFAQTRPASIDVARASLEELMNIAITSAERKEQRAEDVAAAVYVLTQDDIHRSGITTLPELFRLIPGMQVAHISGSRWAISVRGFNQLLSGKLLVLIDGRSVYNRIFSGVFWDSEDLPLEDIDRIEVIRGPGGTTWGANAVNGVINIITKSAADTQGATVNVSGGTLAKDQASVRYGAQAGNVAYRLYSRWSDYNSLQTTTGTSAGDDWHILTSGIRADWEHGRNAFMSQARYSTVEMHPRWTGPVSPRPGDVVPVDSLTDVHSGMLLGRWTNSSGDGTSLQVQSSLSRRERHDVKIQDTERIADVDLQYRKPLAARHDLVVGAGYRAASFSSVPTFALDLGADDNSVTNAFAQDEISLGRGLFATLGAKLEHDSDAGWGVLPSARMLWGVQTTRVWAAVSQARRTPSSNDRQLRVNQVSFPGPSGLPVLLRLVGNPDYRTENLLSSEAGYRVQLGAAAVDVAVFRGAYKHLLTQEPLAPVFEASPAPPHVVIASRYDNLLDANTAGVEIAGHWTPRALWRLDGSYSAFRVTPHVNPASRDVAAPNFDGHTPHHQWQLHSSTWVGSRLQFNGSMYYTGRLRVLQVPDYTRVDAGAEIKLTNQLSTMMLGQNLLQSRHAEFTGAGIGLVPSLVQRSGRVGLRWRF